MHTFKSKNDVIFHHNQDLSGEVIIIRGKKEIAIEGDDLLDFVAQYVAGEKIAELEQMETTEILGIKRS